MCKEGVKAAKSRIKNVIITNLKEKVNTHIIIDLSPEFNSKWDRRLVLNKDRFKRMHYN